MGTEIFKTPPDFAFWMSLKVVMAVFPQNTIFLDTLRGGAAYFYLISILIWPHFDTYPYISIQNILMSTQNILITKIYLRRGFLSKNIQRGGPLEQNVNFSSTCFYII